MENVKFTKGPWHLHDMEHATVVGPDHIAIALCEANRRPDDENMANTRLIAAAPLGYELADAIIAQANDGLDRSDFILATAEEFIAKATGGTR